METRSLLFVLFSCILLLRKFKITSGNTDSTVMFNYTLTTKLLSSFNPSEDWSLFSSWFEYKAVKEHLKTTVSTPTSPKIAKVVNNLYSTLRHFIKDNCLIVVNNFEGTEINPAIEFPLILRQFDLAVGRADYIDPKNNRDTYRRETLWIPKEMVSKLNGNFSTSYSNFYNFFAFCSTLKYFYTLWPPDKNSRDCLGPNSLKLFWSSRPWQCEIQVDLFMPNKILRIGKYTEIFDKLSVQRLQTVPSLRPPVHILVDRNEGIEKYDWASLAAWTSKRNRRFREYTFDFLVNHIQLTGHVACKTNLKTLQINVNCNLQNLNLISPCPECRHFLNVNPVQQDHLSFDYLTFLESNQKSIAFPGKLRSFGKSKLAGPIEYYANEESEAIKLPLKNLQKLKLRFSDKLQMLGFAYASLYSSFLGNLTRHETEEFKNPDYKYFTFYLKREAYVKDVEYPEHNTAHRVNNEFGQLHFVSCGSRGIEPFPFIQFVSVFEWQIWMLILMSIFLLSFSIFKLHKIGSKSLSVINGTLSISRVFVEQGDPFPANFDKSKHMRFLMSGTFLAGLVISNAFKSENMYNIVLPRSQISYYNIDELIEDKTAVYTRIEMFQYVYFGVRGMNLGYTSRWDLLFYLSEFPTFFLSASSELASDKGLTSESIKVRDYSLMHSKAKQALFEPIYYLHDLKMVGIIDETVSRLLEDGNALSERFHKIQEDLILNSLYTCNKTAWVLPNYLAQIHHRSLKMSGKHSDVGSHAYTSSELNFWYDNAYVPSAILKRISWIPTTGLFEWWPKFINRSDLTMGTENTSPTKPNMSGNILVIFVYLGGGLSVALTCLIFEMWRKIYFFAGIGYKFFVTELRKLNNALLRKCRIIKFKIIRVAKTEIWSSK